MSRNWVWTVALLLISCASAVLIAELIVRLAMPQQLIRVPSGLWEPESSLVWAHPPNADFVLNTGEGRVRFVSDSLGFRVGAGGNSQSEPSDNHMLILGDSFIEALQVEHREAIPEVLERRLDQVYGFKTHIRNAGVGGWSPYQYERMAERELRARDYDLGIVFVYAGNDFRTSDDPYQKLDFSQPSKRRFRVPRRLEASAIIDDVLYPANDLLERHSQLFVFLKTRLRWILARIGLTAYYFPDVFRINADHGDRWTYTAERCESIRARFRAAGSESLIVLLPTPYQVEHELFESYVRAFSIDPATVDLELPNKKLRRYAEDFIDVLPCLRRAASESEEPLFGRVDSHLSEAGHAAVVECILPDVAALLGG